MIGLSGDLGAGKTQLVKGLARGLGIAGASALADVRAGECLYAAGRLTLFHLDFYRLPENVNTEQIIAAGLEEYLSPVGVTVIEWADRWFGPVASPGFKIQNPPARCRFVRIEIVGDSERADHV